MSTKVKFEIEIESFKTPDYVTETSIPPLAVAPPPGFGGPAVTTPRVFNLSEVPVDVLDELCTKFRLEVFRKAGYSVPPAPIEDDGTAVFNYPGGQWINPAFIPPNDGEVYQVFNGSRTIAEYNNGEWFAVGRRTRIEGVIFYTEAAPAPIEDDELDSWGPSS